MPFTARTATIATLLLAFWTAAASAQTPWSVMARLGVAGTWAESCAGAPSTSNWFITYFADGGGIARRQADRGPDENMLMSTIDSTQYLTPATFLMRLRNDDPNWGGNDQVTFDTVVEISPRGMQTLASSRISDGKQFIKDRKFTANGNPVAIFQKCR